MLKNFPNLSLFISGQREAFLKNRFKVIGHLNQKFRLREIGVRQGRYLNQGWLLFEQGRRMEEALLDSRRGNIPVSPNTIGGQSTGEVTLYRPIVIRLISGDHSAQLAHIQIGVDGTHGVEDPFDQTQIGLEGKIPLTEFELKANTQVPVLFSNPYKLAVQIGFLQERIHSPPGHRESHGQIVDKSASHVSSTLGQGEKSTGGIREIGIRLAIAPDLTLQMDQLGHLTDGIESTEGDFAGGDLDGPVRLRFHF